MQSGGRIYTIKIFKEILILGAGLFVSLDLLHAQLLFQSSQFIQSIGEVTAQPDSIVSVAAESQGLSAIAREDLPRGGTYWWVMPGGTAVPTPFPPPDMNQPIYQIADGQFLVDTTGGQIAVKKRQLGSQIATDSMASAVTAQADAVVSLISQVQEADDEQQTRTMLRAFGMDEGMGSEDSPSGFSPMFSVIDANSLWLEITNVSNGWSYLNLHNATNQVYAIESSSVLVGGWNVETELWPVGDQTNVMPFSVQNFGRQDLFFRAQDWTGVDSNNDGIPDWWTWKYFGTINITDTNLDYSGNGYTFAQDYSNNVTPTVFVFTNLEVPNNYVSTPTPAVQLAVAGTPYYIATLVDDGNFSNAVWNTYSGSSVTVNLGSVQGWHEVWIGLRGHAEAAGNAIWQHKRLKLDWTPPTLIITNPTNGTVDVPMIQLQGFSPEALSSISYDLTNALGLVTNQQVLVLNQTYDTNTWEFTTNTFQAFDIRLTNGVNTFTLHATDLAGNVSTLVTNFTLNYSSKTNAPNVQITWPQNGMKIANSTVTIRGQVADATVTVSTSMTDTNGVTNLIAGVVERSGRFWLDNIPLQSGTNLVALTVRDVAGNVTTTNLVLVWDAMTLTMNGVSDASELWEPTISVSGAVSDPTATVYVNGVQGTNNGDGTWSADNVPVTDGGVAIFDLNACPAGSGDPANSTNVDKPWRLYLAHDVQNQTGSTHDNWSGVENDGGDNTADGDENYDAQNFYHYNHNWDSVNGGSGSRYNRSFWVDGGGNSSSNLTSGTMGWTPTNGVETDTANDGTVTTNAIGLPLFGNEHCVVNDPMNPAPVVYGLDSWDDDIETNTYSETYTRTADTTWHLQTGGRALTGLALPQSVFQISGSATEILTKRALPPFSGGRSIPPQNVSINGKVLGSDGIMYQKLPDDADVDITPYVAGKDFYTFYVGASKHTLTSCTLHPALTDTNRSRLQVGVGEEVSVYLDPPLTMTFPEDPWWTASAGSIAPNTGSAVAFTAPSNAAFATLTVNVRDVSLNKAFSVLEPSGYDSKHTQITSTDHYSTGQAAAGIHFNVFIAPTDVSFYKVSIMEVGEDGSSISGYFTNWTPQALHHTTADHWTSLNEMNEMTDHGYGGPFTFLPWYSGSFTWDIPAKWQIAGSGATNSMSGWNQVFLIDGNGSVSIEKFGHSVTRTTNNIITTN